MTPPDPAVDPAVRLADELARLRRQSRFWMWFSGAWFIFSLWSWFGAPLCQRAAAPPAKPAVTLASFSGHPSYLADVIVQKEGFGYLIGFTLKDAAGRYCATGGRVICTINDHYYSAYSGENYHCLRRDTVWVTRGDFLLMGSIIGDSFPVCPLPRVDLRDAADEVRSSSIGCLVSVRFIPQPGETLFSTSTAPWPWSQ